MIKVGLALRLWGQPDGEEPRYGAIRATAQWAESVGFDSLWLYDHVLFRSPGWPDGMWECWTVLSALAEATARVELGTLVLCNSFRNPALVAKMATTLDEVSGGRLILGLGAGWNDAEFAALGVPFDHRVDRFEEALQILQPLLRRGRVEFAGTYHSIHGGENRPRGPRPEGPPLLVGAEGPRMLRLAARYADLWNIGFLGTPDALVGPKAELLTACAEVGRDPATLAITALVGVGYPEEATIPPRFGEKGFVTGSSRELSAVMRGYAQLGAQHIVFDCAPDTPAVRVRVAEGVRLFRAGAPARESARPLSSRSSRRSRWPWGR
jgi:probable F420-dependent oxidoreductase